MPVFGVRGDLAATELFDRDRLRRFDRRGDLMEIICHPKSIGPKVSCNCGRPASSSVDKHGTSMVLQFADTALSNPILEVSIYSTERDSLSVI